MELGNTYLDLCSAAAAGWLTRDLNSSYILCHVYFLDFPGFFSPPQARFFKELSHDTIRKQRFEYDLGAQVFFNHLQRALQ